MVLYSYYRIAKIFHRSRPTTVQALLLLGYREFGIGSMEQGWIYIGMFGQFYRQTVVDPDNTGMGIRMVCHDTLLQE